MTTNLYLIRHGEALSVVQKTMRNTGLSPLGVTQAEHLRDRLVGTKEIAADVLISSTMHRARETAEIIAPALGLPVKLDETVEEWRDGDAESFAVDEYRAKFNAVPFEQKPFFRFVHNSESWVEFMLRAGVALNRIIQEHEGKTIVIVCHGGIVDATFYFFFGLSTLHFPRAFFNTRNTSITHWYKGRFEDYEPTWILERYNDSMHLNDIGSKTSLPWKDIVARPAHDDDATTAPTEVNDEGQ